MIKEIIMLTGDHPVVAKEVAGVLGPVGATLISNGSAVLATASAGDSGRIAIEEIDRIVRIEIQLRIAHPHLPCTWIHLAGDRDERTPGGDISSEIYL